MEVSSIGGLRRDSREAAGPNIHTDTDDETDGDEDEEPGSEEESEGIDYLQLFAAAISTLREEEGQSDDDHKANSEEEDGVRPKRQRVLVVRPLEAAYAHFERQEDHLQQAAAVGKMLLERNKQLEEQLDLYQNSPILNEYQDKIRLQQEKIWELQSQEENVHTELEELKVELKVKKRMLNSKTRLAEQLEAKLWDYIQKIEKEKESRDNEENKKMKREMEQREKMRRLSDEVENHKEELKEARSENERLRRQVTNLLDKLGSFRSELTREQSRKSRSNSFSRRLTSFFSAAKNENEGNENGAVFSPSASFGDLDDCAEDDESDADGGSGPGSRRQSGRGRQQFQPIHNHVDKNDGPGEEAEWRERVRRVKDENESLRRELGELAEDHSRLRESVNVMRDHERRLGKERKRERKLLSQAQQTIEELKLRIIDAQLLATTSSASSSSSLSSSSSSLSSPPQSPAPTPRLPLSYSLPSTPHVTGSHPHAASSTSTPSLMSTTLTHSPPPTPSTPQPSSTPHPFHPHSQHSGPSSLHLQQPFSPRPHYQSHYQPQPQQQQPMMMNVGSSTSSPQALFTELQQREELEMERSVREELAAIDDILLGDDDVDITATTPRVAASLSAASTAAPVSHVPPPSPRSSLPPPASSSSSSSSLSSSSSTSPASLASSSSSSAAAEEKDNRVWVVAEGQRGRSGSDRDEKEDDGILKKEDAADVSTSTSSKRESDGRLFIFAEELEKKVVQKFVYDEDELKAGLQEEVEACVADFLAKREQELQAFQPAVLKERRKRALSSERDDLLLFFGVFLTSPATPAAGPTAAADDIAMLSSDVDVDVDNNNDREDGEGEADGWRILDEWRAGRQRSGSDAAQPPRTEAGRAEVLGTISASGTRSRLGSAPANGGGGGRNASNGGTGGGGEGKSLAAVQTWVKHIPFDFGKRQTRDENEVAVAPSSAASLPPPSPPVNVRIAEDDDDELARIEAAISGEPSPVTIVRSEATPAVALPVKKKNEDDDKENEERRERIRAEMARLNGQLVARRKEVEEALRPIVAIVPSTSVARNNRRRQRSALHLDHDRRFFNFVDLVLYD